MYEATPFCDIHLCRVASQKQVTTVTRNLKGQIMSLQRKMPVPLLPASPMSVSVLMGWVVQYAIDGAISNYLWTLGVTT
eukprot:9702388-Karenia_brevis.AAC.1